MAEKDSSQSRRRTLLKTLAMMGAGGLAGCTGQDGGEATPTPSPTEEQTAARVTPTPTPTPTETPEDEDGDGDDGEEATETPTDTPSQASQEIVDQQFNYVTSFVLGDPTKGQWNQFKLKNSFRMDYTNPQIALWNQNKNGFIFTAIKEWAVEDGALTLHLWDNHTWSPSGKEVTAEDFRTQIILQSEILGGLKLDRTEGIQVTDDKTLALPLKDPNTRIALTFQNLGDVSLDTPRWIFGKFVEMFQDATTEDATTEAIKATREFTWKTKDVQFSGPWAAPPEVTGNGITYHRRKDDGYPFLNAPPDSPASPWWINYTKFQTRLLPQGASMPQMVLDGESDFTNHGANVQSFEKGRKNPDVMTAFTPWNTGYGLHYNFGKDVPHSKWLRNRKFRQALAYAIDQERSAKVAFPLNLIPCQLMTGTIGTAGTGPFTTKEFNGRKIQAYGVGYKSLLPAIPLKQYTDYGTKARPQKATQVLEELGFSKQQGTWIDPKGKTVELRILTSPVGAGAFQSLAQAWADSLSSFGFDAGIDSTPYDKFFNRIENKDYQMCIHVWGGGSPFTYSNLFEAFARGGVGSSGLTTGPLNTKPLKVKVPEYGNANGDMITVNVDEKLNACLTASDSEYRKLVSELAWTFNQWLPIAQLGELLIPVMARTDKWEWPEPTDPEFPGDFVHDDSSNRGIPRAKTQ